MVSHPGQKRGKKAFQAFLEKLTKQDFVELVGELHERKKISFHDIHQILEDQGECVPCSIFTDVLSSFEAICKYLKENKQLSYRDIGDLLQRDERTIWTTYQHAQKKQAKKFVVGKKDVMVPVALFQDRQLSVLEHLTRFLKEDHGMRYHEIAELLKRDDRTIWTTYQRALKKLKR